MSRSLLWDPIAQIPVDTTHPHTYVVFCPCEPFRRARRLSIGRGVVIVVVLLLLRDVRAAPAPATGHGDARCICGWMPGDGRERHTAVCMLQDSRLALHV
jgi:hypothetical protein